MLRRHPRVAATALTSVLVWICLAILVDPGLVFAKLQSDAAVYLAQARHLWQEGSANHFTVGDGVEPVNYSPLSAFLRAPLFGITTDPAIIVRMVQAENVILLALLGAVSSAYLAKRLPAEASRGWLAAPWILLTTTYNPWLLNLVLPLADHLYALVTIGALLTATSLAQATGKPKPMRVALMISLVVIGALQKFTSLALVPAIAWPLMARRAKSGRALAAGALCIVVAVSAAAWMGWDLIAFYIRGAQQRYLSQPMVTVVIDSLTNVVVAALPSQVVPNFAYLFHRDFTATHAVLFSDLRGANALAAILGASISATMAIGAWRCRHSMRPELTLILLVIPVYAIVSNSTGRYLASVQPVFIVFALSGLRRIAATMPNALRRIERLRWHALGGSAAVLVLAVAAAVPNLMRSFTSRQEAAPGDLKSFFGGLSAGFERGYVFLEGAMATSDSPTLLYEAGDLRWYPIAGARYVAAPLALDRVRAGRTVIVVFACDIRNCSRLSAARNADRGAASLAGVRFAPLYRDAGSWGQFEIERLEAVSAAPTLKPLSAP